ncbi:Dephospho-CoA kinase [Alkalibacterium gilvum]|uniref:Dephospho-CoA kinase n=1 Tax=Alkalibacterium gilvum TaxID=1130080 RepID=A0A1H6UWR6_9LACT|nr:hypothetical protein [Alkalibacterium gilvum]SEI92760.1 Dephospho-CoA kinase [Alkalibacterium gilvum]
MDEGEARPLVKIGLVGGIRSGKDTVANYLQELIATHYTNDSTLTLGFSDGITQILEDYLPGVFNDGKPREVYQAIGQTFRRFNPDVWIEQALETIEVNEMLYPNSHYIMRDVRQPNEAEALRSLGFTIVKVVADKDVRIQRATDSHDNYTLEDFNHGTELSIDQIVPDIVINNDSTLEELYDTVEDVLLSYQSGKL